MSEQTIYKNFIDSKTGSKIPVLKNDKTIESKYNPEKEAENIINQITQSFKYFIVIGIGSGITLSLLNQKFPKAKIIGIEYSESDIQFLLQNESLQKLQNNSNIKLITAESVFSTIQNTYLPVIDGNIRIIENKAWVNENKISYQIIAKEINRTLKNIGSDYSVQCHFGKIWLKNALNNLKLISKIKNKPFNIDLEKKAMIIAAGPTLEEHISYLKENKDNFFIISTDTAYKSLLKYNILSNAVVSIDGQFISSTHFSKINNQSSETIFFIDICGNSSVCKKITSINNNLYLFSSKNPLSTFSEQYFNCKPLSLESGSGTVTISALDLAVKSGFKKIEILGADFSYSKGKTYTKGTYLEENFSINQNKLNPTELNYDKLLYRTELQEKNKNVFSTDILESYKTSLLEYFRQNNLSYLYENNIYKLENKNKNKYTFSNQFFNYKLFLSELNDNKTVIPLLPFMAFLKNKEENKDKTFEELCIIAHNQLLRYN